MRNLLLLLLLALPGCRGDGREAAPPGSDAADAAASRDDTGVAGLGRDTAQAYFVPADTVVARWAARITPDLLVRRSACPFECCLYRTWTATTEVGLKPEPRRGVPPSEGTLNAGEPFEADSGFVRVTGIMLVVPHDTVMGYGPGDTLLVLDYVGEGFYNLWDGGEVREVAGFWGAESSLRVAETLGRWQREWWTHATGAEGQVGWFSPDSVPDIDGADGCA